MRLERVALLGANRVLIIDGLIRRVDGWRANLRDVTESRVVVRGVRAARRAPFGEERKLSREHRGLERVEARVEADYLVDVGLDRAVRAQAPDFHREIVALRDDHAAIA